VDVGLHELFAARAAADPGATALVAGEERLSYAGLDARVRRLARHLRALGVGPEVRAAVCCERTADLIVALLAVLEAGGAYVPIDPAYPPERQAFMIADSQAPVLITQERLLPGLPRLEGTEARIVCLDRDRAEIERRSAERLPRLAGADNLAYLIYTSGSTGRPKGVAIEHRSAVALVRWAEERFSREELAGTLAATSICFDLSVYEIFLPLAVGTTVILAENALALPLLPAAGEVTLINTVPSAMAELVRGGGVPRSVRTVNLAGEPLRAALVEKLYRLDHVEKVYNLYGPSEDTTYSTWALMRRGDPEPPSIGRPLAGTRACLLDREMRQVPDGEAGELYLGGAGLARGYLGRPELTAERFVPDPFAALACGRPGERLYATGDLARYRGGDPDGEIEFLGRIDHQVKVRGFRVELGEIESALERHPAVRDTIVVARETDRGETTEKVLVAYVVARSTAAELRAWLQARLAEHMVPSFFVFLDALPLTPNGKVDRKALPAPDLSAALAESYAAPRTALEASLAALWAEVLELPRVGIDDDFFTLGGNSIAVTRVLARLRGTAAAGLPPRALFDAPTVARLTAVLEARAAGGREPAAPILRRPGNERSTTAGQEGMWFADHLHPEAALFTIPLVLTLRGPLDPAALAAALGEIVRRHDPLRTTYVEDEGGLVAEPSPAVSFELPLLDLRSLSDPASAAARIAEREARRRIDAGRGPVFSARLLRMGDRDHRLLLLLHHLAGDDWSTWLLAEELAALYAAFRDGRPSPLAEPPVRYGDFAAWHREWLAGPDAEAQLRYWEQRLAGAPDLLELPADRPRPPVQSVVGERRLSLAPLDDLRALGAAARRQGATPFMALLALFDVLLLRHTGREDLVVGSPVAGRRRPEVQGLIGLFTNTLAWRFDLGGEPRFDELLRRVREVVLEGSDREEAPFDRLARRVRPEPSLSHGPLAQVFLAFQNTPPPPRELAPGLALELRELGSGAAKVDLAVFLRETARGLEGDWEYAARLFDAATVDRLIRHFGALLAAAARAPERSIADLPLLTEPELHQVVTEWNDTRSGYPRDASIHGLFEEQARRTPDKTALVDGDRRLSYGELDRRAGRLAARLRRLGVGPEVPATFALERSAEMIVALLAILKAGGAYAPLDPGHPRERLAWLIEHLGSPVLITSPRLLDRLPVGPGGAPGGAEIVLLDRDAEIPEEESIPKEPVAENRSPARSAVGPDNLALVLFTSGTTGTPKGVALPHRGVLRMVRDANYVDFGPDEVFLQLAPIAFDASTFEIWGALTHGSTLVIYPSPRPSVEELGEVLARERVTTLFVTAGLFHSMIEQDVRVFAPVRHVLTGGDVVSAPHARALLEALPGIRVTNCYGPTENTTFVSFRPASSPAELGAVFPIGRPVRGSGALLLDAALRPVPVGVVGDLYASGDALARGYLHRPDLTAAAFVPSPLGEPGARLYRTGDLARWLPTGELDFLGRRDAQVKVRGFRIELGEVETALAAHPGVADAAVVARPGPGGVGDKRLAAFVVARPPGAVDAAALRSYLQERLPEPMVPSLWEMLDSLPLTANGKVDRPALARRETGADGARAAVEGAFVAPRTPAEQLLAGIWSQVLGVETVGVHDGFFELGGHSLLATRLVSRVRDLFGVELPLRAVFERPTIAGLAERLQASAGAAVSGMAAMAAAPRIVPVPRPADRRMPASFPQRRLWFLERLTPGLAVYHIPYALRVTSGSDPGIDSGIDPDVLERALVEVARRHEALRTTFAEAQGEPLQVIAPAPGLRLERIDLTALPEPERRAEALRLREREAARPFDLGRGPLVRAVLARLAEGEHELLLTLHHIVADGWSTEILLRELTELYEAFAAGRPSPLPALPVQYADFAVWQRRWMSGETLAREVAHWRRRLEGAPAALDLPTDRPRPAVQSFAGASLELALAAELAARVRAVSRREGATPFLAVLAAFGALLGRWSGQTDIPVGSTIANRNRSETEGLIGLFVNTLVLRCDLGGEPTFGELLARLRETTLAAHAHQDLPFEALVEELHPQRDLSRSPLFQVMLTWHSGHGAWAAEGLALTALPFAARTSRVDLTLGVLDTGGALELALEHATDLFDEATASRLLGHLQVLLAAALAAPGRRLSELPLLTAAEEAQLAAWNGTAVAYPGGSLGLHAEIEAQIERTPDAVAVTCEGASLTYRELGERAARLAGRLRELGVGAESRVGICAERSLEMIAGLLGILWAGGAYVPLDPSYPSDRLAFMLEDAAVPVLLTQSRLEERLPALPSHPSQTVHTLRLDDPATWTAEPAAAVHPPPLGAAYVIFTSGSTGRPKGVVNSHRGVVNRLVWMQSEYGLTADDRVLQKTPISFDVSVWELFWPLRTGARLVLARPGGHQDPAYLAGLIERERVTTLHFVPSMLQVFVDEGRAAGCRSLRRVIASGEALPAGLAQRLLEQAPWAELHNLYGPTEAAVDVTFHACRPGETRVPIGRPVANTRIHLLDHDGHPVPVGVAGELCIGGVQVARGYLARPDLTADRFVPDPFPGEPGERLYRTGDLARRLPDGELEYLGRLDHQVKVRGHRIELGEIEAALARHPGVREALVLARGAGGDTALTVYVVPSGALPEADLGDGFEAELRRHLQASLPEPMVPAGWVMIETMPLGPSGKADRKALAAIEPRRTGPAAGAVAPRTPAERTLAEIWTEVLGLAPAGVHDRFFDLGGHSILALRLLSRMRDAFGIELPLRAVFERPTIEGLAAELETAGAAAAAPRLAPAPPQAGGVWPASFAQRRLWFLDSLTPGLTAYDLPAALRLEGPLDAEALERALAEIARRHAALRTTFVEVEGEPFQVVAPPALWRPERIDLSLLPEAERRAEALRLREREARHPFDLGRGPLARAVLVRLAEREHELLLTLHHIVSDGESLEVLLRELGGLYEAFAAGRPSPLPELPVQYPDFAVWQRSAMAGAALEREVAHWREHLAGAPTAIDLPTDRPRPAVQSFAGAELELPLPRALVERLRSAARREGVTPFLVVLAAFGALLSRWSGQDDLLIGSPVAGRHGSEVEGLIGLFVNTVVLRWRAAGDASFAGLLRGMREEMLAAQAHQDLPFEVLVEELRPERDLSRSPFFQVLLTWTAGRGAWSAGGLRFSPLPVPVSTAKLDLTLGGLDTGAGLDLAFHYGTDLFDRTTVGRMAEQLARLLEAAASRPDTPLAELSLLGEAGRAQLLAEWNDRPSVPGPVACLHELFEAQAARTPDAVAVIGGSGDRQTGGERLTYAELDRRAEGLAAALRALGIGPERVAGVLMDRTPELIVALLAVLKAGGAYLPLDPKYPSQRTAFMLADSGARVLLARPGLAGGLDLPPGVRTLALEPGFAFAAPAARTSPSSAIPAAAPVPDNLAYLIYTSGSTGVPKGVAIEHRSAVALARWAREVFPPEDLAGVLAATSICFDLSVFEIFVPLAWGGAVIVAEDALHLPAHPAAGEVTLVNTVPSALAELAEALPPAVRTVNLAGEPLAAALVERIPAARVLNLYGPSEDTTYSTCAVVPRGEAPAIGRPIAGTSAYVLDPGGRPTPLGVPGELLLGGAGLARGYFGRPDLTAERFVPDPFGAPGSRLYRTGDLVRYRAGGELLFLGRLDHQVKVRGFRIEPGEIEAALLRLPGVREAAVLARQGASLAAYVVAEGSAAELKAGLRESLPEHMIPSAFVFLPALPLTPNGKIDRRALAGIEPDAAPVSAVAPRTPFEELVAGVWAEVFGIERVGVHDDFFELGGHSLLATRVMSRLRAALGVELPLRVLFAAPTVAGLAALLEREGRPEGEPPLERAAGPTSLSLAQHRLWYLEWLSPGTAVLNLPFPQRLRGPLDAAALGRALREIVRRHEALRTVFPEHEGSPLAVVLPELPLALPLVDLSGLPAERRESEALRLAAGDARRPFDLARGPLLRTALVRLGGEDHLLLAALHHIAGDGWSLDVLLRELLALHDAFAAGEPSPLAEPPVQYADFAAWQRRRLTPAAVSRRLDAWTARFGRDLPGLRLPTDRPRAAVQTFPGAHREAGLPPDIARAARALGRRHGATPFMTLLAAFQALLFRYTGQERIVVGSPVAGRGRAELEGLIGFFAGTLVLPGDLGGDPTFAELLGRVRETALSAYAFEDLPFEKLAEALQPERDRARSPLFQVMFSLQNDPPPSASGSRLALEPVDVASGTSQFDLTLAAVDSAAGMRIAAEYNTDLFDAATVDRLLAGFRTVLERAVARPEARLSELLADLPPLVDRPAEAAETAPEPPKPETDARRDRLAARLSKLTAAQREALEKRLRSGA
jgi:amino acid adenylation domain-containing protein